MALWLLAAHACAAPGSLNAVEEGARLRSARRFHQSLETPCRLRQSRVSGLLIPGAGLSRIRREAEDAEVPEHGRIVARAQQQRGLRIAGTRGASQHQTRRHDVAVLQVVLA